MTEDDARAIGRAKLVVDTALFNKCLEVALSMGVRRADLGPMTLALSILGVGKAFNPADLGSELSDAMQLVSMAEKEWRMEQITGRGRA